MTASRLGEASPSPSLEEVVTVPVGLGERSYDVLIMPSLIAQATDLIATRLGNPKCVVVTDKNVAEHHLALLEGELKEAGLHLGTQILPPGEGTKSFDGLARLCEGILKCGLERSGVVVALGGGVIGDLAGLAASLVRRGVRFVQVPTTLLSQVDSSVGGKTGINTVQGKNLVGTFHQPSLVLADTAALETLPQREFRAGYVEAAKYGLLADAAFFNWLEENSASVQAREAPALVRLVATSVEGKAGIVARDETETGDRMLLNLGHTFGHALEAWAGYSDRLLHGEAIAIGICLAFQLSHELSYIDQASVERVRSHFTAIGLPTRISDIPGNDAPDAEILVKIMGQDKKVRDGKLTLILVHAIGDAFISREVATETVRAFLARRIAAPRT